MVLMQDKLLLLFYDYENSVHNPLSNVAYVALGVRTGVPGEFTAGTRISSVVVTNLYINLPELDLVGTLFVERLETGRNIRLNLTLKNTGSLSVDFFRVNLTDIFVGCTPVIEQLGSPFKIN